MLNKEPALFHLAGITARAESKTRKSPRRDFYLSEGRPSRAKEYKRNTPEGRVESPPGRGCKGKGEGGRIEKGLPGFQSFLIRGRVEGWKAHSRHPGEKKHTKTSSSRDTSSSTLIIHDSEKEKREDVVRTLLRQRARQGEI